MHIVDGEHGHGHCHEHTHTHTHEHTHDHEHCHSHEHTHEAEHSHEHCGSCGGNCSQEKPGSEQEALLSYMLDHNKHHAAELLDVAKKFRETGKEEVAVQIEKAVENFDKGNMYLSLALSLVK